MMQPSFFLYFSNSFEHYVVKTDDSPVFCALSNADRICSSVQLYPTDSAPLRQQPQVGRSLNSQLVNAISFNWFSNSQLENNI